LGRWEPEQPVRVTVPRPGRPAFRLEGRRLRLDLLLEADQARLAELAEPVEVMQHVTQLRHPRIVVAGFAKTPERRVERVPDRVKLRIGVCGSHPADTIHERVTGLQVVERCG
jgi:hypothetical protein